MQKAFETFVQEMVKYAEKKDVYILKTYTNGNFYVSIFSDGTRIKETIDSEATCFKPEFALNADIKITNFCDAQCAYCHENSNKEGKHADLNLPIFDTWKAGTEMAIGGGNALSHPDLLNFLKRMKKQEVVCNITINQRHLESHYSIIQQLLDNHLINGYGVSIVRKNFEPTEKTILNRIQSGTDGNLVLHVIAGIFDELTYYEILKNIKSPKLLILGYKDNVGRGVDYKNQFNEKIQKNMDWLKNNIKQISKTVHVLSFDNLALAQLDVKQSLGISQEEWQKRYQGSDYGDANGNEAPSTFYFDAVSQMIGRSSTQPYNERIPYGSQTFVEAFKDSLSNYKVNESIYGELKT